MGLFTCSRVFRSEQNSFSVGVCGGGSSWSVLMPCSVQAGPTEAPEEMHRRQSVGHRPKEDRTLEDTSAQQSFLLDPCPVARATRLPVRVLRSRPRFITRPKSHSVRGDGPVTWAFCTKGPAGGGGTPVSLTGSGGPAPRSDTQACSGAKLHPLRRGDSAKVCDSR